MLKLGYSLDDVRKPRTIVSQFDPAVKWDATPEPAQKAYQATGDCTGLVLDGEPTRFSYRAVTCTEQASVLQIAGFKSLPNMLLAARLVLDLPSFEWTDAEGKEHRGLPREEMGGLWFVADEWIRQNLWAEHQGFLYLVGRLALAQGPSDLEKKA